MRSWQKVTYIWLPVIVLAGMVELYVWANQSSSVVPQVKSDTTTVGGPASDNVFQISGASYSTWISSVFKVREQNTSQQGGVLERLIATEVTNGSGRLAITIARLPSGGLGDVADITYRRQNPELYAQTSLDGLPQGAVVFRATQAYEVDIYWPDVANGRYAAVALTNPVGDPETNDRWISQALTRWQWL